TLAKSATVLRGREVEVMLTLTIDDGWHLYAPSKEDESARGVAVTLAPGSGANLVKVEYPEGGVKRLAADVEPVAIYEGKAAIKAGARLADDAPTGPADWEFRVKYRACDDRSCRVPATLGVPLRVRVGE